MNTLAVLATIVQLATSPMPAVMERIAQCETNSDSRHATRDFISRYGIYRPAWNEYKPAWVRPVPSRRRTGEHLPTLWEQRAVALAIARRAGLSAWECHRKYGWVRHG